MPKKSVTTAAPSSRGGGASPLRVSLVIPAHNEEDFMKACLEAACLQTEPFYEIIVIDNNSTDKTAHIAKTFPGVRVISEPRQGKVYARTAGMDAAKGEIIARIDADTVLPAEWAATVRAIFRDKTVDAVSGRAEYYDLAWPDIANAIEHFFRLRMAHALRDSLFLQGANMALRRSAWEAVRPNLCATLRTIHEDFDIAIHLTQQGFRVAYNDELRAGLSGRALDVSFLFFISYVWMNPRSYAVHRVPHFRRMYPVLVIILLLFIPARMLFRGRDPRTGKFSLFTLFGPHVDSARVKAAAGNPYLS